MQTGISTACVFPLETEVALKRMAKRNLDNFEIFVNCDFELSETFIRKIKEILLEEKKKAISIHPYTSDLEGSFFFSDYSRRFQDGIQYYQKYFKMAKKIGADFVILHGAKKENGISWKEYGNRLLMINNIAKTYGVEVLLENVERCVSRNPELFVFLRNEYPELGFTLDIKQTLRSGYKIEEMISAMGKRIRHVHMSDHSSNDDCMQIGKGVLDVENLLKLLKKQKFDGTLLIELYGNQINEEKDLISSFEKCKDMINLFETRDIKWK